MQQGVGEEGREWQSIPWNRAARTSVGLPDVGTGQKKALFASSWSVVDWRARLLTLPAFILRRLLLRFRLPALRKEAFFFRVLPRDGVGPPSPVTPPTTEPAKELERCMLVPAAPALPSNPSTIDVPRWLASHSSVNLAGCEATGAAMRGCVRCELARVLDRASASVPPWGGSGCCCCCCC